MSDKGQPSINHELPKFDLVFDFGGKHCAPSHVEQWMNFVIDILAKDKDFYTGHHTSRRSTRKVDIHILIDPRLDDQRKLNMEIKSSKVLAQAGLKALPSPSCTKMAKVTVVPRDPASPPPFQKDGYKQQEVDWDSTLKQYIPVAETTDRDPEPSQRLKRTHPLV